MALSLKIKHFCFILAFLIIASSYCKAQDPIQIIATAALCFDNRSVISSCLQSLQPNKTAIVSNVGHLNNSTANNNSSTTGFCNGPCFGEVMLMLNCIEGILVNFQFYSPGMMQGVASIFGMACGGNTTHANITSSSAQRNVGLSTYGSGIVYAPNHGNQNLVDQGVLWLLVLAASSLLL